MRSVNAHAINDTINDTARIQVDALEERSVDYGHENLLAPFGSRGDVQPMIALAERLDREGHESLIAGPRIMWRLLNDAGRVITGTATLSKISLPPQRADYAGGARRP